MNKPKGNATATSPAATRKPRCRTGKETFVNTPTPKIYRGKPTLQTAVQAWVLAIIVLS